MIVPTWLLLAFPPGPDSNGKGQYQWRVMVWGKLMALLLFAAWSMGLGEWVGLGGGFARAADVSALQAEVRYASVSQISTAIFQMRRDQCAASGQLRELLQRQIVESMREYHRLAGQPYPLPACEELR